MKTIKRLTIMMCMLLLTVLALTAAVSAETVASGTCGDNLTWTLDGAGTLTVSGTGDMDEWFWSVGDKTPWYNVKEAIKAVVIEDGVTSIGGAAFEDCTGLRYVTIADSVTLIDDSAFSDCTSLQSVNIPAGATLDYGAFYNCSSLTSVTMAGDIYALGAFENCAVKELIIAEGTETITYEMTGYFTTLERIVIPNSVTRINWNAFKYCTNLTGVYITDIAAWCKVSFSESSANPLYYAKNLYLNGQPVTDLVIPDGVSSIGSYAFYNCTGLQSVIFPSNKISIYYQAFAGCTGLKEITISNAGSFIVGDAFENCAITKLIVTEGSEDITSDMVVCHSTLEQIVIPDSVTYIGYNAFANCTGLKEITLPDNVTYIDSGAFGNCTGLQSISVSNNISRVASDAFYGCTNLKYNIYDNAKYLGNETNPYILLLEAADNITSCQIHSDTKAVNEYAFYGAAELQSVTIPDSVIRIGSSAFENCTGLQHVNIGNSVVSIGYQAFYNCTGLTGVYITDIAAWCGIEFGDGDYSVSANPLYYAKKLYLNGQAVTDLVIPDGIKSISARAFYNCSGLQSIKLPEGLISIGEQAFKNCSKLKDAAISEGVTELVYGTFQYCSGLENISLPDTLKSVGYASFEGCSSLQSLTIPASVTEFSQSALDGCTGLTGIWVDENNANYSSDSIGILFDKNKTVLIFVPQKVSGSLTVPASVTEIQSSLSGRSGLTGIWVDENNVNYSSDSQGLLYNKDKTKLICVPGGYSGSCKIPASVTEIESDALTGCSRHTGIWVDENNANYSSDSQGLLLSKDKTVLIRVPQGIAAGWTIPESVTAIGDYAFQSFAGLETVTLPDSVTRIGTFSFLYCSNLKQVTIGKDLNNIDWGAFSGCYELTDVFFRGTQAQAGAISISNFNNNSIKTAKWHYDVKDIVLGSQIVYQCSCCEQYQYPNSTETVFADISNTSWQTKFAIYAFQKGLMAGKGTDADGKIKFDPNSPITRAEFVQVLYNAESKPSVSIANKFPDVQNAWYKNAVLWANSMNIANGMGDGNFGVSKNITRQDLALMLYKYASLKGVDLTAEEGKIDQFADGDKVSGYAKTAMNWAVKNGVLSGKGTAGEDLSTFYLDPAGTATRAECAAMLKNFMTAFGL